MTPPAAATRPRPSHGLRAVRVASLGALAMWLSAATVLSCAGADTSGKSRRASPVDPGDDYIDDDIPEDPPPLSATASDAGGAFGAASRPAPPALDSGSPVDAGPDAEPPPSVDAAVPIALPCDGSAGPSDIVVTELMIASRAGSNDDGEWVEFTSTRDCTLSLEGLTISSPRGTTSANSVTIKDPIELPPRGRFVVAASADPLKNHAISGTVLAFDAVDVLKNGGDTITLKRGELVIDSVTYPTFTNLEPGRSLAFPADCIPTDRASWPRWSLTFHAWSPGMKGTPNAANDDVACY